MEKNNGMPKFDVWAYGLPGEDELVVGAEREVKLMRRLRGQSADSLITPSAAKLKILSVTPRRKSGTKSPGSTRQELEVEVEVTEGVQRSLMNSFDDGQGLSAFKAGVTFTLVYFPFDKMARVSRSCEVLFA